MLTKDEGHDESVQGQGLTEDEHDEKSDVELVRILGRLVGAARSWGVVISIPFSHPRSLAPRRLHTEGLYPDVPDDPYGTPRGEAREAAAQSGGEMSVSVEQRVRSRLLGGGRADTLNQDDGNDEAVDSKHSRHDDGDDVLDDPLGIVDSHLAHSHTCPPRAPRRSPVGQDAARSRSQIPEGGRPCGAVIVSSHYRSHLDRGISWVLKSFVGAGRVRVYVVAWKRVNLRGCFTVRYCDTVI